MASTFVAPVRPPTASPYEEGGSSAFGTLSTLVRRPQAGESVRGTLQLLVVEATGLCVYPLASSGTLDVGRAEDCDVRVRDSLASRHHAVLHLDPLGIEDRGSANGTHVGNALLAAGAVRPLVPGEAVAIGRSLLLVQRIDGEPVEGRVEPKSSSRYEPECDLGIIVVADVMKQLYATVDRVAQSPIHVLVLGETGTGKDVVVETIHRRSPRRGAPLVRINCAALSEPLLESELFGHERGAFTGAVSSKPGLIEAADRGTVFLDEVGELSPLLQAKLLRVLEAREVLRVGSLRPRPVDVRFVAATNRDLASEVARGAFRADLFFRLNGIRLDVPPLRERRGEIAALAQFFLSRAATQIGARSAPRLTAEALDRLLAHPWPGNVRELRNEMDRAAVLCPGPLVRPEDLCLASIVVPSASRIPPSPNGSTGPPGPTSNADAMGAAGLNAASAAGSLVANEHARIVEALGQANGNQTRAARLLRMPRRTFVAKLTLYGVPRPRKS